MKRFTAFLANAVVWLGILLPIYTLVFECQTHACAGEFFDPIPTWGHVLLIALVPAGNLAAFLTDRRGHVARLHGATALHRAALAPLVLYLAALGPLTMMAVVMLPATILITDGMFAMLVLATLGPLFGTVGWFLALRPLLSARSELPSEEQRRSRWVAWGGLLAGVALVGAIEWPLVKIYERLRAATSVQKETQAHAKAIEGLRTSSREKFLLQLCYADSPAATVRAFGPLARIFTPEAGGLFGSGRGGLETHPFEVEALREIYFRVTGRVFTDQPPPRRREWQLAGSQVMDGDRFGGLEWDPARGGETTGARIRGLLLHSSRMDWHLDKNSALAHGEWTLEFRNTNANAQESRCQILLPPRGCVSRLTLWIDGEPREAAFGAKAQVTQAYRQTVVVEQRDPVLVNMVGPDRVFTQCFPVPPNGIMKIRLGITAPCDAMVGSRLTMPLFLECNFSVPPGFKHAIWTQADGPFRSSLEQVKPVEKLGRWASQDEVPDAALRTLNYACEAAPSAKVWTEDPFANAAEGKFLLREAIAPARQALVSRVIAVIDGSEPLRPHAAVIAHALQSLRAGLQITAIMTTDAEPIQLERDAITAGVSPRAFRGGRDSTSGLKPAMRLARESAMPTSIVWLHGPQPLNPEGTAGLAQLVERAVEPPLIHAVNLMSGRNRIIEQFYQSTVLRGESRWDGSEEGLKKLIAGACVAVPERGYVFTRHKEAPTDGIKVWDQLARHGVFEEVLSAFQGQNRVPTAQAQRAALYQLVTPYSGAVVLETQAQYERAGLKPVDANTTPQIPGSVPEPSRLALLMIGLMALVSQRKR
ncbi:MAG: VIT domain-containing protein [Roseimicrobium sp.]